MKCLQCFIYKILQLSLHKSNCNSLFKHLNGLIVLLFFCRYALYDFQKFSHTLFHIWYRENGEEKKMDDRTIVEYVSFGQSPFSKRTFQFRIWSFYVGPDCPISNLNVHFRIWPFSFVPDRPNSNRIVQFRTLSTNFDPDRTLSNLTVQFRTWSSKFE